MSAIKENPSALTSMRMAVRTMLKSWRTIIRRRRTRVSQEPEELGICFEKSLKVVSTPEKCDDSGLSFLTDLYDKVERDGKVVN